MATIHGQFFYNCICHFCKTDSEKLQRCSACKCVSYCSKQHQKLDWKTHKTLCKALVSTIEILGPIASESCTFDEWKNRRILFQTVLKSVLRRELEPFECQIWMFPKACAVCYSRTSDDFDCNYCKNVAYCSIQHKAQDAKNHNNFCNSLKLCKNIDTFLTDGCYPETRLPSEINSMSTTDDLLNCFRNDEDNIVESILKTDTLIPGAIISYAIEISKINYNVARNLVIHVVGSSSAEGTSDWQLITELVYHKITNFPKITYVFIGPEVWNITAKNTKFCGACKLKEKVFEVKIFKNYYHEIVGCIEKPDLVISFNCGLHEFKNDDFDPWKRSVPFLVHYIDVPFVFTSYTEEELQNDMRTVTEQVSNLSILTCGKNPFASPRPIRDWSTKNNPVFYSNGFIGVIKKCAYRLKVA